MKYKPYLLSSFERTSIGTRNAEYQKPLMSCGNLMTASYIMVVDEIDNNT